MIQNTIRRDGTDIAFGICVPAAQDVSPETTPAARTSSGDRRPGRPRRPLRLTATGETPPRQSGILHNPAQRKRLDRIVPWNRHLTDAISHHDVLALADDRKPRFFQSPNRIQVIDPHNLGHR